MNQRPRRGLLLPVFVLVAGIVAWVSCTDAAGPGGGMVRLHVAPSFETLPSAAPEHPALFVDNVRLRVGSSGGTTVLDTIIEWPVDQDTLDLDVEVEAPVGVATLLFHLEARIGDRTLFVAGGTFTIRDRAILLEPVLEYVGPGADAVSIELIAPATLAAADTLRPSAVVRDGDEAVIPDVPVVWTVTDPAAGAVDASGLVTAGDRLDLELGVAGRVPFTTVADTLRIDVAAAAVVVAADRDSLVALGDTAAVAAEARTVSGGLATGALFTWETPDTGLIELLTDGPSARVVALGNGTARVIAVSDGRADTARVVVEQAVSSIEIGQGDGTVPLVVGDTITLTAQGFDANGFPVPDAAFGWSTDDARTAELAGGSRILAVAPGQALVSASADGATAEAAVDVSGFRLAVSQLDALWGTDQIIVHLGDDRSAPALTLAEDTVTATVASHQEPAWSRDGRLLVYIRDGALYVQDVAAGEAPRLLVPLDLLSNASPAWSPTGEHIAFIRGEHVHVVDVTTEAVWALTEGLTQSAGLQKQHPSWSPDGSRVAFALPGGDYVQVWAVELDAQLQPLTYTLLLDPTPLGLSVRNPVWSPLDDRIAFGAFEDQSSTEAIWVFDGADGSTTRVSDPVNAWHESPSWSPNAARIAFERCIDGCDTIMVVNADGTGQHEVLTFGQLASHHPAWGRPVTLPAF